MFLFRFILVVVLTMVGFSSWSQAISAEYISRINKTLPHKFKDIRTGSTLEIERTQEVVKIYVLIDDIEQYEQVVIERSDEFGTNFGQCKLIPVIRGKYPNNYIELTDKYPVSSKMSNLYRIKTVSPEGIVRMYAPVPITVPETTGLVQK